MADENTAVATPTATNPLLNPAQGSPSGIPAVPTGQEQAPAPDAAAIAAAQAAAAAEPTKQEPTAAEAAPTSALVTPPAVEQTVGSETGEDGSIQYAPTGDAALDVALDFIGRVGIAGDDPVIAAAAKGDFSLLEARLATIGDKAQGWQQMVNLAKDAYTRSQAKYGEQIKATDAAIIAVVESPENWTAIKNWAAANADPEEKAAINKMIDAGPVQARAAATLLLQAYKKATGTVINPANPTRNASGVPVADGNGKLTSREYSNKVAELHRKLGSRMESSPEYKALRGRLG